MKIDLTRLEIEVDFSGSTSTINCSQTVANAVKNMTSDIGLEDICRGIFHAEGEYEIPDAYIQPFVEAVLGSDVLLASVKRSIREKVLPAQKV